MFEAEDEGEELTATDRILYVVTSPRRAFQGLLSARLGGVIGLGLVISLILSVGALVLVATNSTLFEQQKQVQVEALLTYREQNPDLSEQGQKNLEKQIDDIRANTPAAAITQGLISTILAYGVLYLLLAALVIFLIARILERGHENQIRYSHSLAIAALALIVFSVGGLVTALLQTATGSVYAYPGIMAFVKPTSILETLVLTFFSLPVLWWVGVIGVGIGSVTGQGLIKSILWFGGTILGLFLLFGVSIDALLGLIQ